MKRFWQILLLILFGASWSSLATDFPAKSDREPFPQSAKIARDRRAEGVLESVRQQIQKGDFAPAVAALQELLDGPNSFVVNRADVSGVARTADRLLCELPPAARGIYERAYGTEAERLRQAAMKSGRVADLRAVVTRFGQTAAGWRALRDLAARHADRGEWHLAVAAFDELSRHVLTAEIRETGWLTIRTFALRQIGEIGRADVVANPVGSAAEQLPFGKPVWQHTVGLSAEAASWRDEIEEAWHKDNVVTLPSSVPLVIGDVVVSRFALPAKIVAVDARQAKLLWERMDDGESLVNSATELQRHPGFRESLLGELQRRWFGDSVRGRMTSDGRRVFVVQDADSLDAKPGSGTQLRNHVAALDLKSGERIWRIGGPLREPPEELHGEYFLGPPLVRDGFLYVVAQRETVLRLLALRADDGRLEWSLPIAETDRRQFKESSWRHNACEVTWSGGCLLCPTGAGCLVAVEPVTRSLAWSLTFERDDLFDAVGYAVAERDRLPPERWWESWREGFVSEVRDQGPEAGGQKTESVVVLVAPESRSVRGIESRTGRVIWRTNFEEPILAAQQGHSPVLVFERDEVTQLDPLSGKIIGRRALSAPAAAGTWIGSRYVYPMRDGTWAAIDLSNSEMRITRGLPPLTSLSIMGPSRSGRAVLAGDRWVSVSSESIQVWEPLAIRRSAIAEAPERDNKDLATRLEPAWLELQTGRFEPAVQQLRSHTGDVALSEVAGRALRFALLRGLSDGEVDPEAVEKELMSLSRNANEKMGAGQALIAAARRQSEFALALRVVLEQFDLPSAVDVEIADDRPPRDTSVSLSNQVSVSSAPTNDRAVRPSRRTVRRDRWQQGLIADLLDEARTKAKPQLLSLLAERKQQADDSPDPFALVHFGEQLGSLPLGQQIRLQSSGRSGRGIGFVKTALSLRDLADASGDVVGRLAANHDRATAAEAWYRLALLHEFRSEPLEAADAYRQLRDHFADVKLAEGRAVADWLADVPADSSVGRMLAKGSHEPWPVVTPDISRTEELHDDIYCRYVTVESSDPSWRRMSVAVESQGRKVRFHGGRQRGVWDLPLPVSRSGWRHDSYMHKAWGVGPLLVLQIGAELFGIQPLDDRGEANARVLWSLPVNLEADRFGTELRLARLGFTVDEYSPLDQHEQPVLVVLHVGPGMILYRSRESLTAIDPASGLRLWQRHGLRPRTAVSADREVVLIEHPDSSAIETLRTLDGRPVSWRSNDVSEGTQLLTLGRLRLRSVDSASTVATVRATTLVLDDLTTGAVVWRLESPRGAVPLRFDHDRLGVLEPSGTLRILDLADGRELARHQIEVPKTLTHLHVIGDAQRRFLILSGPITDAAWLNTNQDRGGYHKLLVNGWLHSFDRESLMKQWTIPAVNLPISVDLPADLPFLMLSYKRPSADSADVPDGVLHAIDKRTGKDFLLDVGGVNQTNFSLDPRPADGIVELLTKSHRIRFDFAK